MSLIRTLLIAALMISVPTFWGCDQSPGLQPDGDGGNPPATSDDDDDWGDDDDSFGDDDDDAFGDDDDWSVPAECQDELDTADACWDALPENADAAAEAECEALDDILFECIDANE